MKYVVVLFLLGLSYLAGYNQGANSGFDFALKYSFECRK